MFHFLFGYFVVFLVLSFLFLGGTSGLYQLGIGIQEKKILEGIQGQHSTIDCNQEFLFFE